MDYSFHVRRIHETRSDGSSSNHTNSLQRWKYWFGDLNSHGEVRAHPFHSFLVTEEAWTVSDIPMVEQ